MGDDDRRRPSGPDGAGNVPKSVPTPWGAVVIPDDLSELSDEVEAVRRELRATRIRSRWRRRLGMVEQPGTQGVTAGLLIVGLALVVALASLFGGFWPYQADNAESRQSPVRGVGQRLPELSLDDAAGQAVRLSDIRPAVLLAVGRCACDQLISDSAAIARRHHVVLVVVGQPSAPRLPADLHSPDTRSVADPHGRLPRAVAPGQAPGRDGAIVVLVRESGAMARIMTGVHSVREFSTGVAQLR